MASNKDRAKLNEASKASVAQSRAASALATTTRTRDLGQGSEHGTKEASRDPKKEPTPPYTVSLQDGNRAAANEIDAVVVQDAEDMIASNTEEREESEQQDSPQDSQDSQEHNRERLDESKDADASNALGRSPPNASEPGRDHSETMEHDSSGADVQAAGSKTLVPEFSREDEPVETTDSAQGAPTTDWKHQASKTTSLAKPSSASRNQRNKAARGGRTPSLSGQLEQHPAIPLSGRELVDQGEDTAEQEIAEKGKISLPTTKSAGSSTPRGSARDSRKGIVNTEVGAGGLSETPTARATSSKLRPPPAHWRQSESSEHSDLSERGSEGCRTPTTSAASGLQLKEHVFDPPWMKQRPRRQSKLLPLSFGSRGNTAAVLTTSTWARGSHLRFGERRNGSRRSEAFGSLQSPPQFLSTTTQGFFTEKGDRGVKAFLKNQPTGAILCVLLLLAAGIALILLLGVFGGGVGDRRRGSAAVCRTEPCREYSHRLAVTLNSSFNPCEGFTRFVCGGWRRHNQLSVRQMAFLSELRRMSYLLRSVPVPHKTQKPLQRAAAFYRSCDAVRSGDADELPKVKAALLHAGVTWPRLPKGSDPVDLLRTLLHVSLRLRWSAVLHVSIKRYPNATVVTLAPLREIERIVEKHRKLAKNVRAAEVYFETLRRDFGGTAGETLNFLNHVKLHNTYMVPLAGALNLSKGSRALESVDVFSVVPELSKERWMTELGRYGSMSGPLVFETSKPGYVTTFLKLWKANGERGMHTFYSWSTVQTAALFANRRLLVNFYGCEDCADLHHGAFCLSKAYLLGGNQLFLDYFDELLSERAVNSARRVVANTFKAFAQRIDKWPYRDLNYTVVRDWDTATDVALGYFDPHSGLRTQVTCAQQATAPVLNPGDMDDSLVENWQSIALQLADERDRWAASEQIEFAEWTVLLPADFLAVLPYGLSFPSFDESATQFINQGGLGNHVASALSELFLQRYADSPGTAISTLQCATNANRSGDSDSSVRRSGDNDEYLEGFGGYSATAMFFVASCYVLCGGHDGVRYSTGDECDEPFRNVNGFANAFTCELGSPMNPIDKCGFT
ncbi:neprilysin-1-like [Dermacentor silvarum]|uniref:neprilysin-1-like n=1 Tax=Dermacentor silvarum TaxID=543639 RepID=UPI002100A178|nr:neprilysin-1-like [Dermacentor silvarum]